ncbi:substrate-binding domain-containing protein [Actinocorallia populi]|uniref:substrate-binding domain-containing protein n=1 Tax=Actinocorallia populi TaxID=2079200 RepID=UPI000D092C90|nr:substrate-binding domain-containing protein [Actinocorallia populi]
MNSYLALKAEFAGELVACLRGVAPDVLAERTGLLETTVRALTAGEPASWEVVSACLAAAGADGDAVRRMRDRWSAVERAMWDERGDGPRAAFERDPRGRPAGIVDLFQPKVPWRRLTARHPVTFEPWAEPVFDAVRRLPDPASAGDLREFYGLLALLRTWAGSPRQTEIERRSWGALPDATVSAMLQKDRWRTANDRERRRIGYFAAACGLPEPEITRWVENYDRVRRLPPPDDLSRARAEAAETAGRLAEATAENAGLRDRLTALQAEAAERLAEARAEGIGLRDQLMALQAESAERSAALRTQSTELRERLAEAVERLSTARAEADERLNAARAEADEQLGAVRAEAVERLNAVRAEADEKLSAARAEGAELRERLTAVEAENTGLSERLSEAVGKPAGWRRAAAVAVGVVLFACGTLAGHVVRGPSDGSCFRGTLRLVGSTAFEHMARTLAAGYGEHCPDATVEVEAIGSNEGVRALADPDTDAATTIAMHDGHLSPGSAEVRLRGFQGLAVSLVSFAVVVNKDTGVTGLSAADLRSVYAEDGGPVNWKRLGGADLPVRLIGRTEGSGTRTIFEERVLAGPEPRLSSRDCLTRDELHDDARLIRCERSSQSQVLDLVGRTPGAIGYSELREAADARRHPNLRVLALDGRKPDVSADPARYPFVAPEVFYTRGLPANGTPASAFLTFLATAPARRLLERLGAPVCVAPAEPLAAFCGPGTGRI